MSEKTSYRKLWLFDLIVCLALAVITSIIFRATNLDIKLMRPFYEATYGEHTNWGFGDNLFFLIIFKIGPIPIFLLTITALAYVVVGSFSSRCQKFRLYAIFIAIVIGLGPGFTVNTMLKDHWPRPRPRQIYEFGGYTESIKTLDRGISGQGKSFPCGHASAGYSFFLFYFILKRKRKRLAYAALAGSIAWGTLIGIARMARGAHFPSDVLWAGYIVFLIPLIFYHFVLKIPEREDNPGRNKLPPAKKKTLGIFFTLCFIAIILITQVSIPIHHKISLESFPAPPGKPLFFEGESERGNIELIFTNLPKHSVSVKGTGHGFGWISKKLHHTLIQTNTAEKSEIQLTIKPEGFFTELEMNISIYIDANNVDFVNLEIRKGTLSVASYQDNLPDCDFKLDEESTFTAETNILKKLHKQTSENTTTYSY